MTHYFDTIGLLCRMSGLPLANAHAAPAQGFMPAGGSASSWILVWALLVCGVVLLIFFGVKMLCQRYSMRLALMQEELSNREDTANQLAQSQARLDLIMQGTQDGIWDIDLRNRSLFLSSRLKEVLGYKDNEFADSLDAYLNHIHSDDRDLLNDNWQQAMQGNTDRFSFFYRMQHKDGSYRWILSQGGIMRDTEGVPVRMAGVNTDFTERIRYEEALHLSEQRLHLALEANREGLWDFDFRTKKIFVSPLWCRLLDISPEEAPTSLDALLEFVHPDDLDKIHSTYQHHIAIKDRGIWSIECRLRKADGEWLWVRTHAKIVEWDADGRPVRVLGSNRDITRELLAQKQLELSEKTYRELFNATTDAICLCANDNLSIVDANEAFQTLFGYSKYEVAGLRIRDISLNKYPFNTQGLREIATIVRSSGPQAVEWRCKKKNGQLFWAEALVKSVMIAGVPRILSSMRDITARMQTQQALADREQTLRSILEAAPLVICLISHKSIVWSNRHMLETFGYTPEEVEGVKFSQFFENDDTFSNIRQNLMHQLRMCGEGRIEAEMLHKDGTAVPVALRVAPMDAKRPTEEVICIITDITSRKLWEKALMDRETRYRDIFDNAPVGILRATISGQALSMNKALSEMLGYDSPEEAINVFSQRLTDLYANSARRDALKQQLQERNEVRDIEVEWQDNKGNNKILSLYLRRLIEGDKELVDGFATDITEKRNAERLAKQRDEQLIQVDKLMSLGILTAGVAHEVNNPNNFIAINAPLLKKAWEGIIPLLDDLAAEKGDFTVGPLNYSRLRQHVPPLIDGIISGSQRIKKIVEDMKRFARQDAQVCIDNIDINLAVQTALSFINTRLAKSNCVLEVDYAKDLPTVSANAQQIEQVVLNLVINALDAMPTSGGILHVSTSRDQNGYLRIMFIDQGTGIKPDDMSKLFDPFFTTKRSQGGTGLGLAISQKIMQSYGGSLQLVNNEPGPGTTAIMLLPLSTTTESVCHE